ncbi:hypothetical protein CVT25_010249 [Psilocybe cyanescens]|uniref:Uncharacterized protein n=1 Tax=Psilocybe cyanescens TaxID=93625 RepID=A0A409X2R0_PSICY|nr:hypothetical protein CVT25_010249 [Psilocybe cyanescens]
MLGVLGVYFRGTDEAEGRSVGGRNTSGRRPVRPRERECEEEKGGRNGKGHRQDGRKPGKTTKSARYSSPSIRFCPALRRHSLLPAHRAAHSSDS